MKNKFLYIAIAVLVLILAGFITLSAMKKSVSVGKIVTAEFLCDSGKSIDATFYPDNDTHVDLTLSDGRRLSVPHAISGSGARYANADESFVFWNKGDTAFVTENGTTTFANCAIPQTSGNTEGSSQPQIFANSTTTNGVSFQYPPALPTKYIHSINWPPQAQISSGPFTCTEAGKEIAQGGQTAKQTIGGQNYCVTKEGEGAAGSIYITYTYAFPKNDKVVALNFTLREVQCANYDDPSKTECQNERDTFNIDTIIGQIAQTLTLN